ncbi:MAG: DsbA family oxidoreductase [Candidatus Limnocylindrales bacterium]
MTNTSPADRPAAALSDTLDVDIWSDLVCPWCYLGRARFELALAAFDHRTAVRVTNRAFELDPAAPRDTTTTVAEMLAAHYGGQADTLRAGEQRLVELTAEIGLGYQVDRLHGNTFDAHRLVQLGLDRGVADGLVERLYRANFAEGRSIFEPASLTEIAVEAGLDRDEARAVVEGTAYGDRVRADEQLAAQLGISGVPFFVLDHAYGISGAQATEMFSSVLDQVWQERHA